VKEPMLVSKPELKGRATEGRKVCVRQASSAAWTWLCTRRWEPPEWKMNGGVEDV
jgi:hypothetical protein